MMDVRLLTVLGIVLVVTVCVGLGACAVVRQPRFGKLPEGDRLDRIQQSPNYREGSFQNLVDTPKFSTDDGLVSIVWKGMFDKAERLIPDSPIPSAKTDLKSLPTQTDTVVWLGHSSWYIQAGGMRFLIDPILSDHAAPFSYLNKAFDGTNIYTAEDIPEIDVLLISHDHWDHLDYPTVTALEPKVRQAISPLGIGAYLEYWGFPKAKIREGDWNDTFDLGDGVFVHVLPARHYSGRLFKENKTLWAGFALVTPRCKIFFSGDSGYGPHFSEIGQAFNGFDLVLLDCGQYDPRWAYIHMTPEEAVRAAGELGAKAFIPAHAGRFTIANHAWNEPFIRVTKASRGASYQLLTPRIGEPVVLNGKVSLFSSWWAETDGVTMLKNHPMLLKNDLAPRNESGWAPTRFSNQKLRNIQWNSVPSPKGAIR